LVFTATAAAVLACRDTLFVGSECAFGTECDGGIAAHDAKPSTLTVPPVFDGTATEAPSAPRPTSGGTLITLAPPSATPLAVASDPDEDAVDVVMLGSTPHLVGQVLLQPGDEPGRLVADPVGRVHVVLRGGGAVATIYPNGPSLLRRDAVCSAPRGIDYYAPSDSIVVVCATGELMMMPSSGGAATLSVVLDRDLRDVVVDGNTLYVTRFRSAEVLTVDLGGHVINRSTPTVPNGSLPDVAWRAVHDPSGGVRVLHQIASTLPIVVDAVPPPHNTSDPVPPAPYGASPPSPTTPNQPTLPVVSAAVTPINVFDSPTPMSLVGNPAIDLAVTSTGMFEVLDLLGTIEIGTQANGVTANLGAINSGAFPAIGVPDEFVAIADARDSSNAIVVQRRAAVPALIIIPLINGVQGHGEPPIPDTRDSTQAVTIPLPQRTSHVDTGFDVFHVPTAAGVACMNCHPEGGEDGHTWLFKANKLLSIRRTQALRGGVILNSAPYHWEGDVQDMQGLCDEIFTHRMGGGSVLPKQAMLLARFLDAIPRIPVYAGLDPNAVEKGRVIFEGSGGCMTCHSGPLGTSPFNQDIGKTDSHGVDTPMQIPMLIGVADRAPYLHDGCAATLMDRLTNPACAGTKHGNTAQLSADDRDNLVQFLESM